MPRKKTTKKEEAFKIPQLASPGFKVENKKLTEKQKEFTKSRQQFLAGGSAEARSLGGGVRGGKLPRVRQNIGREYGVV